MFDYIKLIADICTINSLKHHTMKKIGFATVYFTLWEVSKPYKEYVNAYSWYWKQDFTYIQNLSMNLDDARRKAFELTGKDCPVDETLRGHTETFHTRSETFTEPGVMPFGKYGGTPIEKINDSEYLRWVLEQAPNDLASLIVLRLRDLGFIVIMEKNDDDTWYRVYTQAEYEQHLKYLEYLEWYDSTKHGHFFENGQKVNLEVALIGSFGFRGQYGYTSVQTFVDREGRKYKYVGKSPVHIEQVAGNVIPDDDWFYRIQATIKHSKYTDTNQFDCPTIDETKLIRVKVLEPATELIS